jgi:histidinol-phosphate aminotransferase
MVKLSDDPAYALARDTVRDVVPYQPGKPIEELQRERGLDSVVKLASNENPLGASPKAIEAVRAAAAEIHLYPDGGGFYLKKALGKRLGVAPEQVILGSGSVELIELVLMTFINEGDEVVSSQYAFAMYAIATKVVGGRNVVVPARGLGHDLPAMAEAIGPNTRVVFIANPNNPTGTFATADEFDEFMAAIPHETVVVYDEAYYEYVQRPDCPDALSYVRDGRNILVLRTFSKAYGLAGLRIGYGVAREGLTALISQVRSPFNTTRLAQLAAVAALDDYEHVRRAAELVVQGRARLCEGLQALGLTAHPSEGNFVLFETNGDGADVSRGLEERGIIVRPMRGYGLPNHIRVTVGTSEQNEVFLAALAEVVRAR